jgi:phage gpG-like protein
MRLTIDLAGDVQVSRELLRFAGRMEDATPAFRQIASELRGDERRQFDELGGFASGGWRPLAPSTVASKLRSTDPTVSGNAERPLHATERLMRSLTDEHDQDHIEQVEPDQLTFGTSVPYASFHQLGEGVPQRRPLEVREQDRRGMVRTLQRFMVGTLAA